MIVFEFKRIYKEIKILELIKEKMFFKDAMTQKELTKETGINLRTLQRRFNNPKNFRLHELIIIFDVLGIEMMVR